MDLQAIAEENSSICRQGVYRTAKGTAVSIREQLEKAIKTSLSIRPRDILSPAQVRHPGRPTIAVEQVSTLGAAQKMQPLGERFLVLNFANGLVPGGDYLLGGRAQEESLCRSGALYEVIKDNPMYGFHQSRPDADSTDWAIYSPGVPVFRDTDNQLLDSPITLDFITCAAPDKELSGHESEHLLDQRIKRLLGIAAHLGYEVLLLGAWGCGVFGNDPRLVAGSFRTYLEGEFAGCFRHVHFAIHDMSPDLRIFGPFSKILKEI